MKKVLIVIVAFIAVVNVVLNMYNRNEILGLSSLKIEALARYESGNKLGPLYRNGCVVFEKVIMGYNADGSPHIQEVPYPGETGECAGAIGDCTPYGCIKYY